MAPKQDGEGAVLAAIAEMSERDRPLAERLHRVITEAAPGLTPKLWYEQPAYAGAGGKVVCFFRGADVDGERYLTFGFSGEATLDEGGMWATSFAVTSLSAAEEARVAELVRRATS